MTDAEELRAALPDLLDVLAQYGRDDGARDWCKGGAWLRPGEVIARCHADLPDRIARLLDALEDARAEHVRLLERHNNLAMSAAEHRRDAARYRWLRTFWVDSYKASGTMNYLDARH